MLSWSAARVSVGLWLRQCDEYALWGPSNVPMSTPSEVLPMARWVRSVRCFQWPYEYALWGPSNGPMILRSSFAVLSSSKLSSISLRRFYIQSRKDMGLISAQLLEVWLICFVRVILVNNKPFICVTRLIMRDLDETRSCMTDWHLTMHSVFLTQTQ